MSLGKFLNELQSPRHKFQLAKPFLFEVIITKLNEPMFSLLCHNVNIPGISVLSAPSKIYGTSFEVPYELAYEPMDLTCYMDKNFRLQKSISSLLQFNKTNFSPVFYDNYIIEDISIVMFDIDNQSIVATYRFKNCVLKGQYSMNLDWSAKNQVQALRLSFTYEYYTVEHTDNTVTPPLPDPSKLMNAYSGLDNTCVAPLNWDTVQQVDPAAASKFTLAKDKLTGMVSSIKNVIPKLPLQGQLSSLKSLF
jgi:hypothetical protein